MSYCRFAWQGSDVYVYNADRGIFCCGCRFDEDFVADEPEEMIAHLARHRRAGHYVPEHAITSLWADIPGAQRPRKKEPPLLTASTLGVTAAMLKRQADEAMERHNAKEAQEALEEAQSADAVAATMESAMSDPSRKGDL